jgi:hypothetical protein
MLKKNAKEKKSKTRVISSIGNLNNMNKKCNHNKEIEKKMTTKKIIKRTRPKPIRRIKQSNVEGQN